ncbi:MAG: response regulator [Nannocystaceae bacterium]|nr:response regulator [Nannocystaceae bacterium]
MGEAPTKGILDAESLGQVLAHMREGFQVIGSDWRYLFVNDEVCRQGRQPAEALLGRTMMEVYPGIDATPLFGRLSRCMRERVADEFENEFTHVDGTREWFEVRVQPVAVGISVLTLDVSVRKSLELQLRHSQKMEAIGRLAGGVAHDFNNILTAISTFAGFAAERVASDKQASEDLSEVLRAASRAGELVKQLLAFSRRQPITPKVLSLDELVARVVTMLGRIVGETIELEFRPSAALWPVRIDPGAFEQVLVNLAVNARDAMPRGGRLTIETGNVVLDQNHRMAKGGEVEPGDYVMLAMTDEGSGMDETTMALLFEPFFTTKPFGRGTGLGLSTCYGIVRQAGGHIWVYSEVGRGSTFKIYLPRVRETPLAISEGGAPAASIVGRETVLVVEDDAQVREIVVRVLSGLGYRVLAAPDGDVALQLREQHGAIDLLLTDVVMPRISGRELATRLQWVQPGLKVLFMSGYSEDAIVHHGVLEPGIELLPKPFTPKALAQRVRDVLDGKRAP